MAKKRKIKRRIENASILLFTDLLIL